MSASEASALIFINADTIWPELKATYNGQFKNLIYGELPKETVIFETLIKIKERLKTMAWTIKLDSES